MKTPTKTVIAATTGTRIDGLEFEAVAGICVGAEEAIRGVPTGRSTLDNVVLGVSEGLSEGGLVTETAEGISSTDSKKDTINRKYLATPKSFDRRARCTEDIVVINEPTSWAPSCIWL
jgi:hypothetical protein